MRELEDFPLTVNSPQIENIALPPTYQQAVLEKERARENAEQEKHTLERQRLGALQAVNSAAATAIRLITTQLGPRAPATSIWSRPSSGMGCCRRPCWPRTARCSFPSGRGRTGPGTAP